MTDLHSVSDADLIAGMHAANRALLTARQQQVLRAVEDIPAERLICRVCGRMVEGYHSYLRHLATHEPRETAGVG